MSDNNSLYAKLEHIRVSLDVPGMAVSVIKDDEIVFDEDNIKVVADKRSALFLEGLNIDFSNDLIQAGFRLTNPNAADSCACGSSFAT